MRFESATNTEADPSPSYRLTGFYFSVQSGGSFDIDYTVQNPDEKVILEGRGERQGDYIFTANTVSRPFDRDGGIRGDSLITDYGGSLLASTIQVGEYSFCFENESSMTAKLIDFE